MQNIKIDTNNFAHSAITLLTSLEMNEIEHEPEFWKFNNSLLMGKCYTEMITKQIHVPNFITKYCSLSGKGLFSEMIKKNGN